MDHPVLNIRFLLKKFVVKNCGKNWDSCSLLLLRTTLRWRCCPPSRPQRGRHRPPNWLPQWVPNHLSHSWSIGVPIPPSLPSRCYFRVFSSSRFSRCRSIQLMFIYGRMSGNRCWFSPSIEMISVLVNLTHLAQLQLHQSWSMCLAGCRCLTNYTLHVLVLTCLQHLRKSYSTS